MQTHHEATAHSLYVLYQALPKESKHLFLKELLDKQAEDIEDLALYLTCQQARQENDFLSDEEAKGFINRLPQ
jgi:hypothetical protein